MSQTEYESHNVKLHAKLPAYPGHADIEILGLTPQGRSWENDKVTSDVESPTPQVSTPKVSTSKYEATK